MPWAVRLDDAFQPEFDALSEAVQEELVSRELILAQFGPDLGRPTVDTLSGSRYSNMKELRFNCEDGVWRVAFAFDPKREAILLAAGDKKDVNQERFYRDLIKTADDRFAAHLKRLKAADEAAKAKAKSKAKGKRK
jgi:hypothetical protein